MKEVLVVAKCDYPDCGEVTENGAYTVWGYANAKGRKPAPVAIDLCDKHYDEVRSLMLHFHKVGDADNAAQPEVRK